MVKRAIRLARPKNLMLMLVVLSLASAFSSYVVMTRSDNPFGPDPEKVLLLGLINVVFFVALIVMVAQQAIRLWLELKKGSVGSRLQTRMVVMVSLITIIPTLSVAGFSAFFLNAGIKAWFSEKVNTGLEESVSVAEAYLKEHRDIIQSDLRTMAFELDRAFYEGTHSTSPAMLNRFLSAQVAQRGLAEAAILQRGTIIARSQLTFAMLVDDLTPQGQAVVDNGETLVIAVDNKIRAAVKLHSLPDAVLIIGRIVDERVVDHMENAQAAVNEYRAVREKLGTIQIQVSILFLLVAFLLLLAALWVGMRFAAKLVIPITQLVEAAERVRAGDYATRVDEGPENDELATLGRAFNRMTNQLAAQRRDLLRANRQIDNRRRFSEAVLTGVSAGVIALDSAGVVTLCNRSVENILHLRDAEELMGQKLVEHVPEFAPLVEAAMARTGETHTRHFERVTGERTLTLHGRIAALVHDGEVEGFILTFDDISALVSAQRTAAWSDVARRVAHEIKNPLTPIQLAAQRLRRKYLPQVAEEEHENFIRYTDTIIRHVGDIGRMVEEFVQFARMPAPDFARENLSELVTHAVFSQEATHPHIVYALAMDEEPIYAEMDVSQIRQVLTNLVKNAAEAVEGRMQRGDAERGGHILVALKQAHGMAVLEVKDNGIGFPQDQMHRLLEPYVTTRAKGTGLGLAIVKKIMEDHGGRVELENRPEGGALVRLLFPLERNAESVKTIDGMKD